MIVTGFMFFGYSFRGNARLKLTIPTMVVLMEESGVSLRSHDMRRGRQHDKGKELLIQHLSLANAARFPLNDWLKPVIPVMVKAPKLLVN